MADLDVRSANTAADETRALSQPNEQHSGSGGSAGNGSAPRRGGRRPFRVVVAAIAVLVIAFCAWSMSEYVNGRDPLAFLGGSTVASEDNSASQDEVAETSPADQAELTSDEVSDHITNDLVFEGVDVTVAPDDFKVLLKDSGVWVDARSNDDAEALVRLTAERTAALASWLHEQGAQTAGVTWITEDVHGIVRVAVCDALDVSASGNTAALLEASRGYLISPETYAGLGDVSYAKSAGEAPTLADGTALEADTIYSTDENGNVTGTTPVSSDQSGSATDSTGASSPNSNGGEGSRSSGSGSANGSAGTASRSTSADGSSSGQSGRITVTVTINGSATTVSVPEGSTALDALRATGASVNAGANPYGAGSWVYGINGQEQGTSTSHGWTYTVNGTMPGVMSDLYVLSNGASVSWNFV